MVRVWGLNEIWQPSRALSRWILQYVQPSGSRRSLIPAGRLEYIYSPRHTRASSLLSVFPRLTYACRQDSKFIDSIVTEQRIMMPSEVVLALDKIYDLSQIR